MSKSLLDHPAPSESAKPEATAPEKFRDPATGALQLEALLKSYAELEKRLARSVDLPKGPDDGEAHAKLRKALGVPDAPEGYRCAMRDPEMRHDLDIDRRLHAAGFTPEQAQVVYDLACEYVLPAVRELGAEQLHDGNRERLREILGGDDAYREVSRQVGAWGSKHLPPQVFEALSSTHEGVIAMQHMMKTGEPNLMRGAAASGTDSEAELDRMMRDPRYWRDRDPQHVAKVTEGFKRLYRS